MTLVTGSTSSTATCSYTPPATNDTGGAFSVVATSSGDNSYGPSTSNTLTQNVLGYQYTLLSLSFSANPAAYNAPVTLSGSGHRPDGQGHAHGHRQLHR